jgi:hypothetical protein
MPIRRARREAAEYQRQLLLRDGEEPMQNPHHYVALTNPPDVRHPRITKAMRAPQPIPGVPRPAPAAPAALPAAPPLTEADAAVFSNARTRALEIADAFLKQDFTNEYDPSLKAKLILKQLEVAQNILSLGGRIDPAGLRGAVGDEIGEMLKSIKGEPKV